MLPIPIPAKVTDLSGRTFGRLKVRAFAGIRNREAYWACECECGTTGYEVRGKNLTAWGKAGRAISCGCYRADPIARKAARLTMSEEDRRRAAKGEKVTLEKSPPVHAKAPPIPKGVILNRADRDRLNAAPAPLKQAEGLLLGPAAITHPAQCTLWVVISQDRSATQSSGCRLSLRHDRADNTPRMQSRNLGSPSAARHEAKRLFGDLHWLTNEEAGLQDQPWVLQIGEVRVV